MPERPSEYEFVSDVDMQPVEINKVKRFAVKPMSAEEAAENLDMVGHDFYIFANEENGAIEVVYRRKDGSVGLLQPYVEE